MPDNSIYRTLVNCLSGTKLSVPATAFRAGGIADVLTEYFPNATLVVDNVTLAQQGEAVTFQNAVGGAGPLNGMAINATFSPGDSGVVLLLTATPPGNWTFDQSWPLLANTWMAKLAVTRATLTLTSVAQNPLAKGLNFAGEVTLGSAWDVALWLLGGSGTLPLQGPIGQQGTVPTFAFTVPIGKPVNVPVLGSLTFDLQFSCAAVSGKVNPPGSKMPRLAPPGGGDAPISAPWVPQIAIGVSSNITLAGSPVGIFVDLSAPDGLVPIVTDLSQVSLVSLEDFADLLPGVDLTSALPPTSQFDPGQYLQVKTLTFTLAPAIPRLVSVAILLGSTKNWPVTDGISVGPIDLSFTVGLNPTKIMASLVGTVDFPDGAIELGAYYPGFIFTGALAPDSQINLTDLMKKVLPISVSAMLILDELNFVVQPSQGNFSLTTGLVGDWSVPVGIATIDFTGAWMQLDRQSGSTTGTISVDGNIKPPSTGVAPITFSGTWTLPGTFSLTASIPDIDLTALASHLTDQPIPSGVPDVALTNGALALTLNVSTSEYNFMLAASAAVNGTSIGSGLFVVRKSLSGSGLLVGFVIPETWSPAQIWSDLGSIFSKLMFSNSGLLISTLPPGSTIDLPNLNQPSLPATVDPGFTFFTSLALKGDILGPISNLFDDDIAFHLLAVVDTATPANSVFKAIYQGSKGKNAIQFTGLTVTLQPQAAKFSISAGALLTIQGKTVKLDGEGDIQLEPPLVGFSILIEQWVEPFGINNLTVNVFGLKVTISEQLGVTLLGSFDIGSGNDAFTFVIGGTLDNFEDPEAIVFELQHDDTSRPLMLSDLIKQFTSLDLSTVPVLGAVGFNTLDFWVVADPAGFHIGDYNFPPGIGVVADIFVYSWEAKLNLQVSWTKGIIASGSINNPITLAGIFTLSDTTGTAGPSASIDTTAIVAAPRPARRLGGSRSPALAGAAKPYFTMDGQLVFLSVTATISAQASGETFDFDFDFKFSDAVKATLECSLIDDKHFSANTSFLFDLDTSVGPLETDGFTLVPQLDLNGPDTNFLLAILINPTVIAQLTIDLDISWQGERLTPHFTRTVGDIGGDLTKLNDAVIAWLKNNVDTLFADFIKDAKSWVAALEGVFSALLDDILNVANTLANHFGEGIDDVAGYLKQLGYSFQDIVNALVHAFRVSIEQASKAAEGSWDDNCAMSQANDSAYGVPGVSLRELQFALTATPRGQQMLLVYHGHGPEIWELLADHPRLRLRLQALAKSPRAANDLAALVDTGAAVLFAVAPRASPELRAHIDALIPELMRYRHMSHREFLQDLRR
jgi:hypothetical protein